MARVSWFALSATWLALLPHSLAAADAPLAWKFNAGDKIRYLRVQDRTMKNTSGGQTTEQKVLRETTMTLACSKVDADGAARVSLTIDRVKVEQTSPKGVVKYDTASTVEAAAEAKRLAETLKPLIGFTFLFRVSPRGVISEVGFSPESEKRLGMNAALAKSFANADALRQISPFFLLAEKPEAKSWEEDTEFSEPIIGTRKLRTTYTRDGVRMSGGVEVQELKLATKATLTQPADVKIEVQLKDHQGTGTIQFDGKAGRLLSREDNDTGKMTLKLGTNTVETVSSSKITLRLLP
jgi:hypothetical protein